jgi:hypothetical protein
MRSAAHLCIYTVYSEEQNACSALTNSTCKHYNRLENARNGCMHGYLSHLHLFLSLVQMAPITINKNGSQRIKPGPKTSPSTDTAPPTGKYGHGVSSTPLKIHVKEGCTHTGREVAYS